MRPSRAADVDTSLLACELLRLHARLDIMRGVIFRWHCSWSKGSPTRRALSEGLYSRQICMPCACAKQRNVLNRHVQRPLAHTRTISSTRMH